MTRRIQVVVGDEERERFREHAVRAGLSLSAWLRDAGNRRIADAAEGELRTVADLDRFFAACDRREIGREPDWDEHLEVMRRSRLEGSSAR